MSKIGRSFIKHVESVFFTVAILWRQCPGQIFRIRLIRLLDYLTRILDRKYRNIPESHVTSHCSFLHGIVSHQGQEGVRCNTVDLEPTDARRKFRNFNITFPRISLAVPKKKF